MRFSYLSVPTTRKLPLRSLDLQKFGPQVRLLLFIPLPAQLPRYYMVCVMKDEGFLFGLMSCLEESDGINNWLGVEELGWIGKGEEGELKEGDREGVWDYDVATDELNRLYRYCT